MQVIRRIDTRIPTPLLSAFITPPTGLGKLADFRSVKANTQSSSSFSPSWRPTTAGPPATTKSSSNVSTQRGWTSVVTSGTSTSAAAAAAVVNTSTHSSVLAPKPTTSSTSSSEVPPVSHGSTLGGVVGSSLSRTVSPALLQVPSEPVPEDWEDDV